jgi:hypothetical protein
LAKSPDGRARHSVRAATVILSKMSGRFGISVYPYARLQHFKKILCSLRSLLSQIPFLFDSCENLSLMTRQTALAFRLYSGMFPASSPRTRDGV